MSSIKKIYYTAIRGQNYSLLFSLFLGIIFIFLIVVSSFHTIGGFNVESDFYGGYAVKAEKMLHGGKYYDEDHGPGYIFPLIFFYLLLGDIFVAGKILSVVSTILFLLFSFLTIKSLFDDRLAFYSTILLFLFIASYSFLASTDMFFAFLTSLSIYLIFRKGIITNNNLFWSGLIAGYAFMTRLNAVIIPAAILFSFVFINPQDWSWKQRFKGFGIFFAAMILGSLPWYIMNLINYGKLFVSAPQETLGASLLAEKSASQDFAWGVEKQKIGQQYPSLFSLFIHNAPIIITTIIRNFPRYLNRMLLNLAGFPAYLFCAPGLIFLTLRANKTQLAFLTFPFFGFSIYTIMSFIPRFYIYIAGFLALFIVYFLFDDQIMGNNKQQQKYFNYISRSLFLLVLLFNFQKSSYIISENLRNEPRHIPEIARFLETHSEETDAIIARKPHLGYFSHRRTKIFPRVDSINELINYCRQKGIRFVYYGIAEANAYPELKSLKNINELPDGIKPIFHKSQPDVYLFEIE